MGIRINTVLGYGFRYTRGTKDPRFSPWVFGDGLHPTLGSIWNDVADLRPIMVKHYKALIAALPPRPDDDENPDLHWLERIDLESDLMTLQEKGGSRFKREHKGMEPIVAYDVVKTSGYATEMERPPMVITHPLCLDWSRHDDIIDYYSGPDEPKGGIMDSVRAVVGPEGLPRPLYPWESYVNRRTGERVRGSLGVDRALLIQMWIDGGFKVPKRWKPVLAEGGVTSMLAYQRDIVPMVPRLIVEITKVLGLFRDPLTVYRLKPMIYRYWC